MWPPSALAGVAARPVCVRRSTRTHTAEDVRNGFDDGSHTDVVAESNTAAGRPHIVPLARTLTRSECTDTVAPRRSQGCTHGTEFTHTRRARARRRRDTEGSTRERKGTRVAERPSSRAAERSPTQPHGDGTLTGTTLGSARRRYASSVHATQSRGQYKIRTRP